MREVILRKKPDKVKELEGVLTAVSGEIDRQLGGTKIAAIAEDNNRTSWRTIHFSLPGVGSGKGRFGLSIKLARPES